MKKVMTIIISVLIVILSGIAGTIGYLLKLTHATWGTTDREADVNLPGDEIVVEPKMASTRAICINATPEEIFPWLLQMGHGRGGFYSYTSLENLVGIGIQNADQIMPEFQKLKVGDTIRLTRANFPSYTVDDIQKNKALILRTNNPAGDETTIGSWVFYLRPITSKQTRLIIRSRLDHQPSFLNTLIWHVVTEPLHFAMEQRMLSGIKERAERGMPLEKAMAV